jgi:2-polyprenyl-6-methoxyphenol hydroxylase-like FAD-dependent oxidoreductase
MKSDEVSISPEHIYDVVIVGAGPVGLATAIALRKRGVHNILVIDQARDFRRVGQVVDLLPNGLKAIKYMDTEAYQQIREAAANSFQPPKENSPSRSSGEEPVKAPPRRVWQYKNLKGEITHSIPLDFETWMSRYGEGRVSIAWYNLQTILRSLLPSGMVQANHRCVQVHQKDNYISVDWTSDTAIATNPFAHWEMQPLDESLPASESKAAPHASFRARLVVAADGINSTIRKAIYEQVGLSQWAKPQYSGFVAIGCLEIGPVPSSLLEPLDAQYFQGDQIMTLSNDSTQADSETSERTRCILFRKPDQAIG